MRLASCVYCPEWPPNGHKREMVHHRKYRTRQEAMAEISEHIRSVLQPTAPICQLVQSLTGSILEEIHQAARGGLIIIADRPHGRRYC